MTKTMKAKQQKAQKELKKIIKNPKLNKSLAKTIKLLLASCEEMA